MSAIAFAYSIYPQTGELVAALQAQQRLPPDAPARDRLRLTETVRRLVEGLTAAARENPTAVRVTDPASAVREVAALRTGFPVYDATSEFVIGQILDAAVRPDEPAPVSSPNGPPATPALFGAVRVPEPAPASPAEWSPFLGVSQWAKIRGVSRNTMAKQLKEYLSRNKAEKGSRQSWRLVLSELTTDQRRAALERDPARPERPKRPATG